MNLLVIVMSVALFGESYSQNCASSIFPPDPKSGCCGHAVGGEKKSGSIASINEFPWMAIVEFTGRERPDFICGAVLISGRYVISVAHCFKIAIRKEATPVGIRLGEYDTNNNGPDCVGTESGQKLCNDGDILIPIEKITAHPEFNKNRSRQNDIALVRLARMAPYTDFIRPICLPLSDITVKPPKNLYMIIAGWGAINSTVLQSNVLRRILVPYVDFHLCQYKYKNKTHNRVSLSSGQLCAGSKNRDACGNDAGGPLMYTKGQITEVTGIISSGLTTCGHGMPSVYTKVFSYIDWMKTTMEADEQMSTTSTVTSTKTTSTTPKTRTTSQDFDSDLIFFRE